MKSLLLMLAVAAFAIAGAVQKEQPKKTTASKTAVKRSPTPAKKLASTAKPTVKKKEPDKKTATTKKQTDKKKEASKKPATASSKNTTAAKKPPASTKAETSRDKAAAKARPVAEKPKPPKKNDKADFEKALALDDPSKKVAALVKFLSDHPKSDLRAQALESLAAARFTFGAAKYDAGDREAGVKLFRQAIAEAPVPYPEKLFTEVISKVPPSLLSRGESATAVELAEAIEKNASASAPQLLSLARFHLSVENGESAKRLAEAAIKVDENSVSAYQTLGMAHRLNFDLESAAAAYAKAAELDPASAASLRSVADMKRALGKPDEALTIYNGLLEKDAEDVQARTGRILALFGSGKKADAEAELAKSIEADPANFVLLGGVAYWYATAGENTKAVDLAGKAIAAEPRYVWPYIALARAFSAEGRLAEAEQVLLRARKYGNFPTLEYEIALVRFSAGFYREAAEELQRSFAVNDGVLTTKLGRRLERSEKSFTELLANERRASIFAPNSPDNAATTEQLKALLELRLALSAPEPDPAKAVALADAFAIGSDKMRYHRQVYAANSLVEKKIAPEKALELMRSAIASVDDGLAIPTPAGPLMASELYDRRTTAMANDRYVVVPDVSKQTLSALARGRIEEIAGASLLLQGNKAEAVTRLKRAVSVLPEKSTWWRSSMWRLGAALEADGKEKEALDAYVKSYASAEPDATKYAVIEAAFKRVNGGTEGLEALIGTAPAKSAEKVADTSISAPVETKKETIAAPIEEKPAVKEDVASKVPAVEEKLPESKKVKEDVPLKDPEVEEKPPESKKVKEDVPAKDPEVEEKPPESKKVDVPARDPKVEEKPPESKKVKEDVPAKDPEVEEKPPESKKVDVPAKDPEVEEKSPESKKPVEEVSLKASDLEEKPPVTPKPNKSTAKRPSSVARKRPEPAKPAETEAQKPLFEPIIIEIKKSDPITLSKRGTEADKSDPTGDKDPGKRPRVVEGKEIVSDTPVPCAVNLSQENVSIIGGAGSVGILAKIDGGGESRNLTATSSSPKDIDVAIENENVGGLMLFVIRSLTPTAGVYQVTFAAQCGKKDVVVKVR